MAARARTRRERRDPRGPRAESLRHTDGVRADLEAAGVDAGRSTGREVLDLLAGRFDPSVTGAAGCRRASMHPDCGRAVRRTAPSSVGSRRVCTAAIDLRDRSQLRVGGRLERCLFVSHAPEQTWLGWLLHLMQAPRPFAVSVHVHATDRYRERGRRSGAVTGASTASTAASKRPGGR